MEPTVFDPIAPAAAAPVAAPDPNLDLRMQGWRAAFQEIRSDPALQWGLLRLGTNLMQVPKPGEGQAGLVGRSIQDAMDYTTQRQAFAQKQAMDMENLSLRGREVSAHEREGAERVAASQQERSIKAASAPISIAQQRQAYESAAAALRQIEAEEKAGIRDPDFLRRKAQAAVTLQEAHARLYDAYAQSVPGKNTKQTQAMRPVENADGSTSFVSSVLVNGEQYFHTYTPPRFGNIDAARAQATKDVDKVTPSSWNPFGGQAPYAGTREQEIERRTQEYMKPRVEILGPRGPVSEQDYNRLGGSPENAPQTPRPMEPARPTETPDAAKTSAVNALRVVRGELADARKAGQDTSALEREEQRLMQIVKTGDVKGGGQAGVTKKPATPPAPAPTPGSTPSATFIRNNEGKIVPQGAAAAPAPAPAPVAATPQEAAGQKVDAARAALVEARRTLQRYGVRQQRADPAGYRAALTAMSQAQNAVGEAEAEYQKLLGPVGPARMPIRPQ